MNCRTHNDNDNVNDSTIPNNNENYKEVNYWNERYAKEESYEWCKDFGAFKTKINCVVGKDEKILILGCGNSGLSLDLYSDGYKSITNIDYSSVVIERMKAKEGHLMEFKVMDMRHLDFETKFDIVIEKCTLDVLFTGEKSPWTMSNETTRDLDLSLAAIKNVLSPNGKFISITFAEPYFRRKCYSKYWDKINVESFGDFFHYYFYVME